MCGIKAQTYETDYWRAVDTWVEVTRGNACVKIH